MRAVYAGGQQTQFHLLGSRVAAAQTAATMGISLYLSLFWKADTGYSNRSAVHVTFVVDDLYLSTLVRNSLAGLLTETPLARCVYTAAALLLN